MISVKGAGGGGSLKIKNGVPFSMKALNEDVDAGNFASVSSGEHSASFSSLARKAMIVSFQTLYACLPLQEENCFIEYQQVGTSSPYYDNVRICRVSENEQTVLSDTKIADFTNSRKKKMCDLGGNRFALLSVSDDGTKFICRFLTINDDYTINYSEEITIFEFSTFDSSGAYNLHNIEEVSKTSLGDDRFVLIFKHQYRQGTSRYTYRVSLRKAILTISNGVLLVSNEGLLMTAGNTNDSHNYIFEKLYTYLDENGDLLLFTNNGNAGNAYFYLYLYRISQVDGDSPVSTLLYSDKNNSDYWRDAIFYKGCMITVFDSGFNVFKIEGNVITITKHNYSPVPVSSTYSFSPLTIGYSYAKKPFIIYQTNVNSSTRLTAIVCLELEDDNLLFEEAKKLVQTGSYYTVAGWKSFAVSENIFIHHLYQASGSSYYAMLHVCFGSTELKVIPYNHAERSHGVAIKNISNLREGEFIAPFTGVVSIV